TTLVPELCNSRNDPGPCLRGVEAGQNTSGELTEVGRAPVPRWYGMIDRRSNQLLEFSGGVFGVGPQRAVLAPGAGLGHQVERALKSGVERQAAFLAGLSGVEYAVEDHRPDVPGEHLGVDRPEPRAVALPDEGERFVPDCGA